MYRFCHKGFTLLEIMIVVVIISILASVAIPAFMKYIKRSKTAEMGLNLRKIWDGEVTYYQEERVNQFGDVVANQFVSAPVGGGTTPPIAAGVPGINKVKANWSEDGWRALKFGTDSPVQFCYNTLAEGTHTDSTFSAYAYGDLDGDGITSLFLRSANIDANGNIKGAAGVYSQNELE